jgi:hypothetical protein
MTLLPRSRLPRLLRAALLGCALLVAAGVARAEHVEVRLSYERGAGAESCPDAGHLRAAVAARLGYDPFVSREDVDTIAVRIERKGALRGSIDRRAPGNKARNKPTHINSKGSDCSELGDALAVAIAIAVDPLSLTREPAAAPAEPKVEPPAAVEEPETVPDLPAEEQLAPDLEGAAQLAEAEQPTPIVWYAGLGPSFSAGVLPSASYGARVLAGFSYDLFELDVEGRFDAKVDEHAAGARFSASLVLGNVAPCVHYSWVVACAVVSVGALRGTGLGFDHSHDRSTFYSAVGTRWGLEIPLWRVLALRLTGETLTPLVVTHLEAGGKTLWTTPMIGFSGGALLIGRFP